MIEPLILTLQLDPAAQSFYEELRQRHFPPHRNRIPAHLTLFHHLPAEDVIEITLREAALATPPFPLTDPTLRFLGRGVAVFFRAPPLLALHATLSTAFDADLIPQDRQRLQPHIVIQNKVAPETARHTLAQLQADTFLAPQAIGLTLWRYLGGPWEHLGDIPFDPRHPPLPELHPLAASKKPLRIERPAS